MLALLGVLALIVRPRPEHVPGHAYPIPEPGKRIRVEVLNGTRRQGLARTATRALRAHGVDVVFFATGPAADSTRIFVRRGEPGQGRDVAEALGAGRVTLEPDTLRRVDVTILLGPDYRPRMRWHP
ncbi:MAG TPA: LytR C-terminal domain-containing protein [Gemmatimonadales bacterium]|nr:LytR C-terminal domain-containing protein [Gemmatimonadales bacterium]